MAAPRLEQNNSAEAAGCDPALGLQQPMKQSHRDKTIPLPPRRVEAFIHALPC
jgi:hypothetical protein